MVAISAEKTNAIQAIFSRSKAVIGVIHCDPFPGSPKYRGKSVSDIVERALRDAENYISGGVHGLIIENHGDIPFSKPEDIGHETSALMAVITEKVRERFAVPLGINVLANAAIPAMAMTVVGLMFEHHALLPISALLEAALYFYAAGGLIAYMLRDQKVSADELFAAGATFTLLAWGFGYAYFACQAWYPGSFTGFEPDRPRTWMELLFYSFSNLSATGLGDVLPVNAPARVLTMLEQFAGVGYIATVVSHLIGLTIVRQERSDQ